QREVRLILFRDETNQARPILQRDFHRFETIRHLFGWEDQSIGQLYAREPPGYPGEIRSKQTAFASGRGAGAVANVALEAFVDRPAACRATAERRVAQQESMQFFVRAFSEGHGGRG